MTIRSTALVSLLALGLGAGFTSWLLLRSNAPKTRIDTSRAAVVKEMRQLGRLETSSFTIEKIIEASKDAGGPWRNVLFGDKLLLIAHGDVVAGVDLFSLDENAISVSGTRIEVRLPPPQILAVRLDNEQTRVYDRDQGFLSRGDKDLESEARQAAEAEIRDAACQAKILEAAAENAAKQIRALLGALGFVDPVVELPPGRC